MKDDGDALSKTVEYLARYANRVALSNSRLAGIEGTDVLLRYKDYRDADTWKIVAIDGVEFIGRFLKHLLPPRMHHIRRYGWMARRTKAARDVYPEECVILQSIPGVGKIICLTILLEVDQISRFPTRQKFCSYCRLVHPRGESDGKLYGSKGRKQGNPYLKWAFSEAVACSAANSPPIKKRLERLEQKYGSGKGKSILAHKFGRSAYHMLVHKKVFDLKKFLRS